jgi:hypothetical protein
MSLDAQRGAGIGSGQAIDTLLAKLLRVRANPVVVQRAMDRMAAVCDWACNGRLRVGAFPAASKNREVMSLFLQSPDGGRANPW